MVNQERLEEPTCEILCLLLIVYFLLEFYKRFFFYFVLVEGFQMDFVSYLKFLTLECEFGFGYSVIGCLRQVFNVLGIFLLFGLGFRVLQCRCFDRGLSGLLWNCKDKSSNLRNGVCSESRSNGKCGSKFVSFGRRVLKLLKIWKRTVIDEVKETKVTANLEGFKAKISASEEDHDENGDDDCEEDKDFDVMTLRKMFRNEKHRLCAARMELMEERVAAATAAREAMAMILRLQNEKSFVEMEAKQFQRLAKEKQIHDQGVIQSLRCIVMKYEQERKILKDQLELCRQLLNLKRDDVDDPLEESGESSSPSPADIENALDNVLISSLDRDLSSDPIL